jgi:hypothetical protein
MGRWDAPAGLLGNVLIISPWHPLALGGYGMSIGGVGSAAWPSANRAFAYPVRFGRPVRIARLWWFNGATVSGNVDVGIYDRSWRRLANGGPTAQAGASAMQIVTLGAPLVLPRGYYYLALAMDNATGTMQRVAPAAALLQAGGCAQMDAAYTLPAVITPASIAAAYFPEFGALVRPTP